MAAPLSFSAYTGWVDVTDPANIPPGTRLIAAADLLRYENFLAAVRDRINAHELSVVDLAPKVATLIADLDAAEAVNATQATQIATLQADLDAAEAAIAGMTRGIVVTASSVTMTKANRYYISTGTTPTFTLPPIAGNTGVEFVIKNRGSGILNVQGETNKIYQNSAATVLALSAGNWSTLLNDGTYWVRVA